ncbi:MAG: TonB-dependent receptor [Gemmatimonadales bacterium]|nr:TonB-dependent receptor [Gemmatimonadales bacterium]NIN13476.1 TonB-dependent receptor [Gemmatimonadales bacterium]NIQ99628.1 TonB-dependent receptor [Gemmatimonadales bacterium]NIS64185.1 TonB-dependent receptor [Gemmatimonadales bacterium]
MMSFASFDAIADMRRSPRWLLSRACAISALAILAVPLAAQERRDVVGTVLASRDSTPLVGVHVQAPSLGLQVTTGEGGRFLLRSVPRARLAITFARIGVVSDTLLLGPDRDSVTVYLGLAPVELTAVEAGARLEARERFERLVQPSIVSIDREAITRLPAILEADVVRAVQLLPGAVAVNDYTVGFNVRGGEPDQNLIQLDGVTIFNPSHIGGLFSTFDAGAVDRVDFITGAFPAEYGGRLSSVMDVSLRRGRSDRFGARGQLSLLSSKVLLEGPIGGSGMSFLVGGRRTYADLLISALSDESMPYYFADGMGKLSAPVGPGSLSATGYWGRDVIDWQWIEARPGREGVNLEASWGNRLVGLRFSYPLGRPELTVDASVSRFSTEFRLEPGIISAENTVRMLSTRAALALAPGATHDVRIGAGVESYCMTYDVGSESFSADFFTATYAPRVWSAFVDDQWRAFRWLLLRPGLRMEVVEGPGIANWAPRIGFKAFLSQNLALTGSVGRYHQAIHSLRDQNVTWNIFDFWIGADSATPVARSDHLVLGFERWFGPTVSLSVEGYRKTFRDIIDFDIKEDPKLPGDETLPMHGSAWGADILLRKYVGGITGWIAYGLAKVTRRSQGTEFPAVHDRRHTVNVVLQMRGPFGSDMSVRWGYGSPLPFTPFVGEWRHRYYQATEHLLEDFDREPIASPVLNSARYPYYNRFDVSFRWEARKWGGVLRPYLQIVNVLNRKNVFLYTFDYSSTPATRSSVSQLPLLPSIGVEFEF